MDVSRDTPLISLIACLVSLAVYGVLRLIADILNCWGCCRV